MKRLFVVAVIVLLMGTVVYASAHGGTVLMSTCSKIEKVIGAGRSHALCGFLTAHNAEHSRLMAYFVFLYIVMDSVSKDLENNLHEYVVIVPSASGEGSAIKSVLGAVISIMQVLYVFAIAGTCVYLILFASTPSNRSRAKYMLGRMVMGIILVSLSPFIIDALYGMSSAASDAIISQQDEQIVVKEYSSVLWKCYWLSVAIVALPIAVTDFHEFIAMATNGHAESKLKLSNLGLSSSNKAISGALNEPMLFLPRPDFTFPLFMTQFLMIFMIYSLIALRYVMMVLWAILLPMTIFFTTFEVTKGLGKNMIEQTLFYPMFQFFFAMGVSVVGAGLQILPAGHDYFGIGVSFIDLFSVSFFTLGGLLLFLAIPFLLLIFVQRLLV